MFEQSILKGAPKTRRVWTVLAASLIQIVVVGVGFLLPLVAFEKMPQVRLVPPLPPPPRFARPEPPGPHVQIVAVVHTTRRGVLFDPTHIPNHVEKIVDKPLPPEMEAAEGVVGGIGLPGGSKDGVIGGIVQALARVQPVQPPARIMAVTPKEKPPERIRISEGIMQGKLLRRVSPVYPPLAQQAHISGTVRLQAVISRDGRIQDVQVVSGSPLLVRAAVDAVLQWIYQPTTLNGVAVEVLTTVGVNFVLR